MKKIFTAGLVVILLNPLCEFPAQRRPRPSVETTKLKENFYNIFVHDFVDMLVFTGSEGMLLVDSGMEPLELIRAELEKISESPVRYIINTHSNGDHVDGNGALGQDATIIASEKCCEDLKKRDDFPEEGLPNLTFEDSLRIHFNGEEINLYFMPGHTGNDIVVHFKKANIVCLGDLVFSDSFPGIQPVRGGNAFVLEKTIAKLVTMFPEDALFMIGHGRDYTMEDLKAYHEMIRETIALVIPWIEDGLTLDETKKRNPLKDWTFWNSSFFPGEITTDTWIENIYESFHK